MTKGRVNKGGSILKERGQFMIILIVHFFPIFHCTLYKYFIDCFLALFCVIMLFCSIILIFRTAVLIGVISRTFVSQYTRT